MKKEEIQLEEYYEDVFRFLRGLSLDEHLAEECTQETFYRALRSIDSFKGDSELRVWLCSIAKNVLYSYYRKESKKVNLEITDSFETEEKLLLEVIADKEMAFKIHKALHSLKEPYKEIFSLRVFGELSFRDIGALFEKSEHWACVTYHRAKEMIQVIMDEERSR